jgi:hypothetical protein
MTQLYINENNQDVATIDKYVLPVSPGYQISEWFLEQPDISLLEEARTPDQQKHYSQIQNRYTLLAILWQSRMIDEPDDPLLPLKKQKMITRDGYELTWLLYGVFSQIWELLRHCFKDFMRALKKFNKKCPFKTASQVFCAIVQEIATCEFLECQQPYYKFSAHIARQGINQLFSCTAEDFATTSFFLQICLESKRTVVKSHLAQLQIAEVAYREYLLKAVAYRGFSYEWHKGSLKRWEKGGYYI